MNFSEMFNVELDNVKTYFKTKLVISSVTHLCDQLHTPGKTLSRPTGRERYIFHGLLTTYYEHLCLDNIAGIFHIGDALKERRAYHSLIHF